MKKIQKNLRGTFNVFSNSARQLEVPLRYCKGDGKVTFTRPFLILGKVTFGKDVNVLEWY